MGATQRDASVPLIYLVIDEWNGFIGVCVVSPIPTGTALALGNGHTHESALNTPDMHITMYMYTCLCAILCVRAQACVSEYDIHHLVVAGNRLQQDAENHDRGRH